MADSVCSSCGRAVSAHDRHIRFFLPDPVLAAPDAERTPGTWMAGDDPGGSDMLQVPGIGCFIRALLPVRLTQGHTLTFGIWLGVDPRLFPAIFETWWEPEFRDLQLHGLIANTVPPWGLLGTPVEATVRDPGQVPYCVRSDHPELHGVLNDEWPHEPVFAALEQT